MRRREKERPSLSWAWISGALAVGITARAVRIHLLKRRQKGSVVLVTGGNKGLGREIARQYLSLGAKVIILGRDQKTLDNAVFELSELGEVTSVRADITDPDQVLGAIAEIQRRYGRLDGLVNNAGLVIGGPLASSSEDDYRRLLETNLFGTRNMVEAALPLLRASLQPWIINVTSAAGKLAVPYLIPYGASKAALARYSEGLALQLASEGVHVLTVYPSFIHTGVWEHTPVKEAKIPLARVYGFISAMPFISMSTSGAARRILDAQAQGKLKIVIPLSGDIFVRLVYLMPKLTMRLARWGSGKHGEA